MRCEQQMPNWIYFLTLILILSLSLTLTLSLSFSLRLSPSQTLSLRLSLSDSLSQTLSLRLSLSLSDSPSLSHTYASSCFFVTTFLGLFSRIVKTDFFTLDIASYNLFPKFVQQYFSQFFHRENLLTQKLSNVQ